MTKEEIYKIIEAHKNGQSVQYKPKDAIGWLYVDKDFTEWDFVNDEYRVVIPDKIVPYNHYLEVIGHEKLHGEYIKCKNYDKTVYKIIAIAKNGLVIQNFKDSVSIKYDQLLKDYEWIDGTPCGCVIKGNLNNM